MNGSYSLAFYDSLAYLIEECLSVDGSFEKRLAFQMIEQLQSQINVFSE